MNTKSGDLFLETKYTLPENCNYPIIVADKLKTPENMGHIIRLAANFACVKVIFIRDEELDLRVSKIKKVAGAAYGQVDWSYCKSDELLMYIPDTYSLVGVETVTSSKNIAIDNLPDNIALVLGNEIHGISEQILQLCKSFYHIPMPGSIKSMNVTHACSIALYTWIQQNLKM